MSITGFPEDPPTRSGQSISDYYAGMLCAFSIVSALHYRQRTGRGQRIDLALLDSLLVALDNLGERYTVGGEILTRAGNVSFAGSATGVYPASGRPRGDRRRGQRRDLGALLRRSSAATTSRAIPHFATAAARRDRRDEIAAHHPGVDRPARQGRGGRRPGDCRRPGRAGQQRGRDGRRSAGAGARDVRPADHPIYGPLKTTGTPLKMSRDAGPRPLAGADARRAQRGGLLRPARPLEGRADPLACGGRGLSAVHDCRIYKSLL